MSPPSVVIINSPEKIWCICLLVLALQYQSHFLDQSPPVILTFNVARGLEGGVGLTIH